MTGKVYAATLLGLEAKLVEVEVDIRRGLQRFEIVGLPGKAVREAKERVISAIKNSGFHFPPAHIAVNLAPANIPKSSSLYDLPIALSILLATKQIENKWEKKLVFGELSLEGKVRSVSGALVIVDFARERGIKEVFLPTENLVEVEIIREVNAVGIEKLSDCISLSNIRKKDHFDTKKDTNTRKGLSTNLSQERCFDYSHVRGQIAAKRALEIAAAGGHNLIMIGPPGSGKTMLAKCLPSILPKMAREESIEVTKIYSAANLLSQENGLILSRPFRNPHYEISPYALIGGGSYPKPGEVTLANRGVLFLDEFSEFSSQNMELLRQPLEERMVSISRSMGKITYPANFILVAAMNPCKCGFLGDPVKECKCSAMDLRKYEKKLSGPILDRIDLQITVPRITFENLQSRERGESSKEIAERVQNARNIQEERLKPFGKNTNADMTHTEVQKYIKLDTKTYSLLESAMTNLHLSARSYFRILKVARTIADLEGRREVSYEHVGEALSYRIKAAI